MVKRIITTFVFVLAGIVVHAQENNGLATYKVKLANVQDGLQPFLQSLEPVFDNLTYSLRFTKDQSIYQMEKGMGIDDDRQLEAASIVAGKGVYFYENNGNLIIQKEFAGDLFLVEPDSAEFGWKILDERKMIGEFECIKAIGVNKGFDNKESTVIAWFSPQINIPYGPKQYFGLPGLILEVEDKGIIYYCSSISFREQHIKKPIQGIRITEEKLNEYVLQKASKEFGYKN
ncbi:MULTISPECIES: GLPGLI family protein [unclassified Allomuricauda]|uniref:GLPGLI family protein n=1 Tax=unclassified Allomuricauda TaxID=2615049 RepID=UPI00273E60EF|nr:MULTISPECIES: GLPGLI family protein [unclassified Allomuricauda]